MLTAQYYTRSDCVPIKSPQDDDKNFHIAYITACSNVRASCYKIAPANKYKTKQIAGKIIPAIATTTAVVAGLVSIEMYKMIQVRV